MLIHNGRNIFRLTAILCLFYVFLPKFQFKSPQEQVPEHGIGGGILSEQALNEVMDADESGIILTPASLETAAFEVEPESFSKNSVLLYNNYIVQSGENISELAINFGLYQGTLVSVNKITNTRLLQIGKVLKVPNQDGILHNVKSGETLGAIARMYEADVEAIKVANELFSDKVRTGTDLFIPGAKLDWVKLQEINGDLFIWPVSGTITSNYGYRRSPFNGRTRQFHSGIDIRGSMGTPIRAAMSGRVSKIGYDPVFGNHVIINHHSGYRTLYGHMSVIRVKAGAYVGTGERIGDVGSTGQSTGPHLHFTVYKNGVTVNPRSLIK